MEPHGVTADAAYSTLRRSSRRRSTTLRSQPRDIVTSTQPPAGDGR